MSDPTALANFPPPAGEHPLRGRVLDVLVDAGAQPNLDTGGDVAFQANEQTVFVRVTEGEHRGQTLVEVFMAPGELGRIIGRQGRTAAAVRSVAAAAAEIDGARVTVEFRDA